MGLRLDYFVCSAPLCRGLGVQAKEAEEEAEETVEADGGAVRVHDTYIVHEATVGVSDHAPVGLVIDLG